MTYDEAIAEVKNGAIFPQCTRVVSHACALALQSECERLRGIERVLLTANLNSVVTRFNQLCDEADAGSLFDRFADDAESLVHACRLAHNDPTLQGAADAK